MPSAAKIVRYDRETLSSDSARMGVEMEWFTRRAASVISSQKPSSHPFDPSMGRRGSGFRLRWICHHGDGQLADTPAGSGGRLVDRLLQDSSAGHFLTTDAGILQWRAGQPGGLASVLLRSLDAWEKAWTPFDRQRVAICPASTG